VSGPAFDWNAFVNLVRGQNNVTWRNFDVLDVLADPKADPMVLAFLVNTTSEARHDG
jgi:hypothetical protein